MATLYLVYRRREIKEGQFEISVLASSEKIEKDPKYAVLKLETNLKPEALINQIKSSYLAIQKGLERSASNDRIDILKSGRSNEIKLEAPKNLEVTIHTIFFEYVAQQVRNRSYDKLSNG
jgi:hypothetical protein